MRIWLDQVREEPIHWDETEKVAPQELDRPELDELSPVHWKGQVIHVDPDFFLRAHLSYEQTLNCNRCLTPIHEPVDSDVELMIRVNIPGKGPSAHGGEHELKEDDFGTLYVEDEVLETRPILIEQLQLNIPMKPLCSPDCKGLCPTCGIDKNSGSCDCAEETGDPRWAALAALRDRLPG